MEDNISTDTNIDNASTSQEGSLLAPTGNVETSTETTTTPTEVTTDRSGMTDFVSTLDVGMQNNKAWEKFESPQDMAKSYLELQKLVGRKAEVPKDDATPEDWTEFYSKIGRPEEASGYDIKPIEGLEGSDDRLNAGLELAYEAGLTKTQAEKLFTGLMQSELETTQGVKKIYDDNLTAERTKLEDTWGNGFDEMVDAVTGFQKSLGIYDTFQSKGLNGDADLLLFMADIAKKFGESEDINVASTQTVAGLDDAISEVNSELMEYIKKGEEPPAHLKSKKSELFAKRYK